MRNIIRKIFIIFIIFVTMFDFIGSSNISLAVNKDSPVDEIVNAVTNLMGGIVAIKLWLTKLQATLISYGFGKIISTSIAECCGISSDPIFAGTKGDLATPFDIFFNKYTVLDVDYFDFSKTGNDQKIIMSLRTSVAEWFFTLRNVCSAILLCILIYVGIRMALSTVAEEKAKFKKMLMDWAASLALIYVLQYIMIFTIAVNEAIVDFLRQVTYADIHQSMNEIMASAALGISMGSIMATAVYVMIMFQTIAFLITYMNRVIKVGFLILISPMISITYSIDKIGDGKAQALNYWLKEFVYCILIQPFHCVMYLAFVNIAISLMQTNSLLVTLGEGGSFYYNQLVNGLLVILCLKFIGDGEKVVKKIFNFQETGEGVSMAAGMAMGVAALSYAKKAKNIGANIATGANKLKNLPINLKSEGDAAKFSKIGKDLSKMREDFGKTKAGQALEKFGNKAGGMIEGASDAISKGITAFGNTGFGKGLTSTIQGAGRLGGRALGFTKNWGEKAIKGYKKLQNNKTFKAIKNANRRSLGSTMFLMGAAMSYATGSSGLMQAIGTGHAMQQGVEGYFGASEAFSKEDGREAIDHELERRDQEKARLEEKSKGLEGKAKDLTSQIKDADAEIERLSHTLAGRKGKDAKHLNKFRSRYKEIQEKLRENPQDTKALAAQARLQKSHPKLFAKMQERDRLKAELDATEQEAAKTKARLQDLVVGENENMRQKIAEQFAQNGSASKVESAKQEILAIIMAKMQADKAKENGDSVEKREGVDSSDENNLTFTEQEDARRMQEYITSLIDRSDMGAGASDAARDFIAETFGGEEGIGDSLAGALDEYEFQRNAQRYNNGMKNYMNYGGTEDRYKSLTTSQE